MLSHERGLFGGKDALLSASGVYAVDKMGQRWSCGFEINIVDCLLDDLLRGFGLTQVPDCLPVALGWSTSTVPNVL